MQFHKPVNNIKIYIRGVVADNIKLYEIIKYIYIYIIFLTILLQRAINENISLILLNAEGNKYVNRNKGII